MTNKRGQDHGQPARRALGYPTDELPAKRKFGGGGRKPIDDVVSFETY